MAQLNKRIVICDVCKKEDEYTIYSASDLDKIPDSYSRIKLTTPDYEKGSIGFMDEDLIICRNCQQDIIYNNIQKFMLLIKKFFRKNKSNPKIKVNHE